ncbi:MAG TPA: DUF4410 domain-containing protein [Thermoanaerobaculia bacterium]|nr:DUF4410 domain-containing protein [Thermoanaerobaculia bacterium]
MKRHALLVCSILVLTTITAAQAGGGKAPTTPGKYKAWGPDIDEIEIVKTFRIADYDQIAVQPFDTSKAPLPDPNARWYGTLKIALASYDEAFMEAFRKALKAKVTIQQTRQAPSSPKTLIIRGTVDEMDPGSRGGRMYGGFGAGAASSKLSGEIVDAASGEVLLRFTQARRSAGTWKLSAGSDLEVMRDTVHATAQDVAHILDLF